MKRLALLLAVVLAGCTEPKPRVQFHIDQEGCPNDPNNLPYCDFWVTASISDKSVRQLWVQLDASHTSPAAQAYIQANGGFPELTETFTVEGPSETEELGYVTTNPAIPLTGFIVRVCPWDNSNPDGCNQIVAK